METLDTCPVCGSPWEGRIAFRRPPWAVRVCPGCRHGWTAPKPTDDELEEAYETPLYYHKRRIIGGDLGPYRARVEDFVVLHDPQSFLDVGCGTGGLVAAALERGWRAVGTDFSSEGALLGRELYGIDIRVGPFELDLFDPGEMFDLVTMIHVLEHLPDPRQALLCVRELLTPGGRVVIEVPNPRSVCAQMGRSGGDLIFDLPVHLHHFSPESLRRVLEGAGFTEVEVNVSVPRVLDQAITRLADLRRVSRRSAPARTPKGKTSRVVGEERDAASTSRLIGGRGVGGQAYALLRRLLPGYKFFVIARSPKELHDTHSMASP